MRSLRRVPILAGLLFLATPGLRAQQVAITNVKIVDVAAGVVHSGETVLIRDGKVAAVGTHLAVPSGAQVVDGRNRFLMPGLWDMHTHLAMAGRQSLPTLLAYGITGVRDMGGEGVRVLAWRDSILAGTLAGPRVVSSGNVVESGPWVRAVLGLFDRIDAPAMRAQLRERLPIDSAGDVPGIIAAFRASGADFIKIRNFPSLPVYQALAAAARTAGLTLAGHAPPMPMLGAVSDAGFASVEHAFLGMDGERLVPGFSTLPDSAAQALRCQLARNGTAWTPTLVVLAMRLVPDSARERLMTDTTGRTDPRLRLVSPTLRGSWHAEHAVERLMPPVDWAAIHRATREDVRRLADDGVTILSGTDLGSTGIIPGDALHEELAALVAAGLSPRDALATATVHPARVLGRGGRSGQVAPGMDADLVLLDANPLDDISATRRIRGVMAGGRWLDRAVLDRFLGVR